MKPKFWKDLLTDEPFSRKDLIHLQDPMNLSGRNMEQFDHVKKKLRLISEEEEAKLRVSLAAQLSVTHLYTNTEEIIVQHTGLMSTVPSAPNPTSQVATFQRRRGVAGMHWKARPLGNQDF